MNTTLDETLRAEGNSTRAECDNLRRQVETQAAEYHQLLRERDALLVKSQKAFAVAVALQWERDAAARERDAARESRARLVQLWNERGISARSWHASERTWKP